MTRRTPADILSPRLGIFEADRVLRALDNGGYALLPKSEHLDLRRRSIRLAKLEVNGTKPAPALVPAPVLAVPIVPKPKKRAPRKGTQTGRVSVKAPNLAQVPTEPVDPHARKLAEKKAATAKAAKKTPRRSVRRSL